MDEKEDRLLYGKHIQSVSKFIYPTPIQYYYTAFAGANDSEIVDYPLFYFVLFWSVVWYSLSRYY